MFYICIFLCVLIRNYFFNWATFDLCFLSYRRIVCWCGHILSCTGALYADVAIFSLVQARCMLMWPYSLSCRHVVCWCGHITQYWLHKWINNSMLAVIFVLLRNTFIVLGTAGLGRRITEHLNCVGDCGPRTPYYGTPSLCWGLRA